MFSRSLPLCFLFVAFIAPYSPAKDGTYVDPNETDADFEYQGEYSGSVAGVKTAIQVIALGDGKFDVVPYIGGLPGDGWNGERQESSTGELKDGYVEFESNEIRDGVWKLADGTSIKKVHRESPTLGQQPPAGAVVLFDGTTADHFQNGKMTEDGLLEQGCTSKQKFASHQLHLEFRLPYMPKARGQGRGNSGLYLQGRYEVQMLDSFGLEGKQNECGGVYSVAAPKVNMCFPPLSWQTYDIDYTAAKYEGEKLVENPRMTVRHNGVIIHKDLELPGERNTTAAPIKAGPEPGPVYLQNHGNPVRYRNIWVVEID